MKIYLLMTQYGFHSAWSTKTLAQAASSPDFCNQIIETEVDRPTAKAYHAQAHWRDSLKAADLGE